MARGIVIQDTQKIFKGYKQHLPSVIAYGKPLPG
jgi:hypothetical protein